MFNQLKLTWGLKEAWQQTRQTLYRYVGPDGEVREYGKQVLGE